MDPITMTRLGQIRQQELIEGMQRGRRQYGTWMLTGLFTRIAQFASRWRKTTNFEPSTAFVKRDTQLANVCEE